jgi:DNA-binding GntR family transcriptional regulator
MTNQKSSVSKLPAKPPTVSTIVGVLEHEIIFGQLHPRERLIEDELMRRFGATRHRVRQALEELVQVGLACQERHKGTQVRDYTTEEVIDLYEIRHALQSQAISRITFPISSEVIDQLQRLNEEHIKSCQSADLKNIFRLNNEFHEVFFNACGNKFLIEAIGSYAWRSHPMRSRGFFNAEYRDQASKEHSEMIEALIAEDRGKLLKLNAVHINRPRDLYIENQNRRLS